MERESQLPPGMPFVTAGTAARIIDMAQNNSGFASETELMINEHDPLMVDLIHLGEAAASSDEEGSDFLMGALIVWRMLYESGPRILPIANTNEKVLLELISQLDEPGVLYERESENGFLVGSILGIAGILPLSGTLNGAELVYETARRTALSWQATARPQ